MAFFKLRRGSDEAPATTPEPESVEVLRRRARHRLIGAAVLVLLGVVGFPLLFDTQPRPIPVDIPIEIPDRAKVKPLVVPAATQPAAQTPGAVGAVTVASQAAKPAASAAVKASAPAVVKAEAPVALARPAASAVREEPAQPARPAAVKEEPKPARVDPKPEPKPVAPPAPRPQDDGARARALLEGKPVEAPPSAEAAGAATRYIVQVGAFADVAKARETRLKVEHAGLKTYTHVAETKEGKRIRVRVGPFATKAEADKAAEKIRGLDLPAAILTL